MKRPLPVPVQGTDLVDKDGKPTSHNYRWMESLGSSITDTQDEITNKFANVTGTAPLYYCRAWVNFNGTGTIGANQTIRASGNVSSVTKTATGDYTINFTTAMPDANYASSGMAGVNNASANANIYVSSYNQTSSSLRIRVYAASTLFDFNNVSVLIFR